MTPHRMATVQRWTGAETKALRQAMRLSIRDFAAYLGVDARSVNKWEARGASITLRPNTQSLMDTALGQAPDDVKTRFIQTFDNGGPQQHPNQPLHLQAATPRTTILTDDVIPGTGRRSCDDLIRELLRLLNTAGVLITPGMVEQLEHSSINSSPFGHVAVEEYAMLNEHLWCVFVSSKLKATVLPLVCSQLDILIAGLDQPRTLSTHQRLCELVSGICRPQVTATSRLSRPATRKQSSSEG